MATDDREYKYAELPLSGRWRPALDGTELEEGDFQTLTNMRYGEKTPQSVTGMTKINSSVINATYLKPRAGFHFNKSQPAESHLLVQSWNTGLTARLVYENTTAIPSAGNFTATAVWTDTASAKTGRFSKAPDGCMTYCNGKNACVWGGTEYRCAGFLVGDLSETVKYDYTDKINNTLTDSNNIALMKTVTTSLDANTMLMLHMDGANGSTTFTDVSPTTIHTMTPAGNAQISTAQYKFNSASGLFDGSGDYLSTPDDADFDFSGASWSVDFWVRGNWSGTGRETIYYQESDANNYLNIHVDKSATGYQIGLSIYAASSEVVVAHSGEVLSNATWHHVEVTQSGTSYYIFIDGVLRVETVDANNPANYTGIVFIATDGARSDYFKGYLDEFRVSNTARHTSNFTPPTTYYGAAATTCYLFLGSTRPIQGAKFYIGTANTTASIATASYWASSKWNELSITDNTSSAGKTLATTGTITFTSTVSTAKPKMLYRIYAYWYLFTFPGIDNTTSVYYCTVDAPVQQIVDLWDGDPRNIATYYNYTTAYNDESVHILQEDYVSGDTLTYSDISSMTTAYYLYAGFTERMTGLDLTFVTDKMNSNAATVTVSYWNGAEWTSVGSLSDGTKSGTATFGKCGAIVWDAPSESSEFKNSLANSDLLYFYRISVSATLSANVYIDKITGITAQNTIKGYSYPVMWQDRVWLLDEYEGTRNKAACSSAGTVCVFNGTDTTELTFGETTPIKGGATLFTRFGGDIYDNLIIFKQDEIWLVDGAAPGYYSKYKIASNYGLVAPGTLKSCDTGYEEAPGLLKHILIWQSDGAIVMFDGSSVSPISNDIENYFDANKSECIKSSLIDISEAFYDEKKHEYHWLFASGTAATAINTELAYDVLKKKWFKLDRGVYLQIGVPVRDTYGNTYVYGGIDTGYMERLEYGTTFDGTNITSTYRTGDIPLGGWNNLTQIRSIKHIAVAKSTTTNSVTLTHYGDCISTSGSTTVTTGVKSSTYRVIKANKSVNWGDYIFHSINCALITSNENVGYEPIGLAVRYKITKEDVI